MKQILFTIILLSLFTTCKKNNDGSGGPQQQPPQREYTCYLSTTEDYNHVVTNRYTYNDSHFLTKHESYQNGFIDETWLYYKNDQENWIREDHFVHDVGGDYYQSYKKFYLSKKDKVDSMVEYQCVDCGKLNPTEFKKAWYWTYDYDDSLRLTKAQYYSLPHTANGYSTFEYDDQGRMSKESGLSQDGQLQYYYAYQYKTDSLTILTGEPSAIDKALYGYSRLYRENSVEFYNSVTGKTELTEWDNYRNAEGYLDASANSKYASLIAHYKYACFKN